MTLPFQTPWEETFRHVRRSTGKTAALVDSTGVGDPVLERLQRDGGGRYQGFKFSATSRQQLLEGLAVAIQEREITFPDGPIVSELESFEYEHSRFGVRYASAEGLHDDCVMALALAVRHLRNRSQRIGRVAGGYVGGVDGWYIPEHYIDPHRQRHRAGPLSRAGAAALPLAATARIVGVLYPAHSPTARNAALYHRARHAQRTHRAPDRCPP